MPLGEFLQRVDSAELTYQMAYDLCEAEDLAGPAAAAAAATAPPPQGKLLTADRLLEKIATLWPEDEAPHG